MSILPFQILALGCGPITVVNASNPSPEVTKTRLIAATLGTGARHVTPRSIALRPNRPRGTGRRRPHRIDRAHREADS